MTASNDAEATDRIALVTGTNTGIGKVTARVLAEQGMHVFVTCRTKEKGDAVVEEISSQTGSDKVEALSLELGDLD